jgi:DNA-binding NarL/FixJ family response regulator
MEEEKPALTALRVLIVDDHPMIREGLGSMLLSANSLYSCEVDDAGDGAEAVRKAAGKPFDVALVDYQMDGRTGDEVIVDLLHYQPELKVLAVSNYGETGYIDKMMEAGARGYILKNIGPAELFRAIRSVMEGTVYYSGELTAYLVQAAEARDKAAAARSYKLSDRELEVLRMVGEGKTSAQIAAVLHLSRRTVDAHRAHIREKTSAKNVSDLIKVAMDMGLTSKD